MTKKGNSGSHFRLGYLCDSGLKEFRLLFLPSNVFQLYIIYTHTSYHMIRHHESTVLHCYELQRSSEDIAGFLNRPQKDQDRLLGEDCIGKKDGVGNQRCEVLSC